MRKLLILPLVLLLLFVFLAINVQENTYVIVNSGVLENSKVGIIIDKNERYTIGSYHTVKNYSLYGLHIHTSIKKGGDY